MSDELIFLPSGARVFSHAEVKRLLESKTFSATREGGEMSQDQFETAVNLYIKLLQKEIEKLEIVKELYLTEREKSSGIVPSDWFNNIYGSVMEHIEELHPNSIKQRR